MKTDTLKALGVNLENIDARILLDEHFDGKQYGLSEAGCRKVAILREFIAEYKEDLSREPGRPITDSRAAVCLVENRLRGLDHEELWIALLNKANTPIEVLQMTKGSLDSTGIDNRQILRAAIMKKATGIIIYHNHPSGNPNPGANDIAATEKLRDAAKVFDIAILDHIVVSDSRWYSFAEEQTFKFNR